VGDGVEALADGIAELWGASEAQLDAWSAAAHAAAAANPWSARADAILAALAHAAAPRTGGP
jgi:acetyl-CoA acetyltransferase